MRRAARWFGIGLVSAPMLNVADDGGVINGLGALDGAILGGVDLKTWAWLGFFAAIGFGAAWVFARQRGRAQIAFAIACCVPVAAYLFTSGPRVSGIVAAVALTVAFVSWRGADREPPD